jgi:hypothetical protein
MIYESLAIISGLIAVGVYVPYAVDIWCGRVLPARSTRIMLTIVIIIVLLQQQALGGSLILAVTIGEAIGTLGILAISITRGVGGLSRVELLCYGLLIVDIGIWWLTNNALLALHLSILADSIAFAPTLIKTWRLPRSETPLFYIGGSLAPILSIIAGSSYSYQVIVFPLYLVIINLALVVIMYRPLDKGNKFGRARIGEEE